MADYQVNYTINAHAERAIIVLEQFSRMAGKMVGASKSIDSVVASLERLQVAMKGFKNGGNLKLNITTGKSVERLKALEVQANKTAAALERAMAFSGKGGAMISGGRMSAAKTTKAVASSSVVAGTSASRRTVSHAAKAPSVVAPYGTSNPYSYVSSVGATSSRAYRPTRQMPIVTNAGIKRKGVIPKNIGYRILGPSFLDSGSGAVDMIKGMGIMYGLTGIGAMMGGAVSDYVDYNNVITTAKSILSTHDKRPNFSGRFANMEKNVRTIGMRTKFTAPEVADAARYLAMAGLDIDAINKAMTPITNIALISDSDLGQTADVVTNIMTAYRMKPEQMQDIADHLTVGFTMSNTTLMEMAEAYKYFGSIAQAMGVDFKETVAMLGVLGDAGLKGSHAGTTMRQILNNMIKPTKKQAETWAELGISTKDENGHLKSMIQLFQELANAGAVEKAFHLFRVTAAQGATSMIQDQMGSHKLQRIYEAQGSDAGLSNKLGEAKINNVQGLWKQIQSSVTEMTMRAFEEIQPEATGMMKQLISWLQSQKGESFIKEISHSLFDLMKTIGEITARFIEMYRIFAPVINMWLKFQLIIGPILSIFKIFRGLMFGSMGVITLIRLFGKGTLALGGFMSALRSGGWAAGKAAFTNAMNGVASTAEQTANRVVAANNMMLTGQRHGTKTPLGYMYNGSTATPAMQENWLRKRTMYEQMIFGTSGSRNGVPNAYTLQNMHNQIQANNARMASIVANPAGWFGRLSKAQRQEITSLRTNNSRLWGMIGGAYQSVKPSTSAMDFAQQQRELVNGKRYDALRKMDSLRKKIASISGRTYKEREYRGKLQYKLAKMQQRWGAGGVNMLANQYAYDYWTNKYIAERQEYERQMAVWNEANKARTRAGGPNQFYGKNTPFWKRAWQGVKGTPASIRNFWAGRRNWGTNIKNWAANNPHMTQGLMGAAGAAGGILGGIAGSALGSSDYSGMIWGTLGSLLPVFASTGPVGWIAGAVAGVGALTYEFVNMSKATDKARESLLHIGDSVSAKNGFLSGTNITDMERTYSLMYGRNMSINDVIASRVELLGKQADIEDYLAGKQEKSEWEEGLREGFIEGYEQIRQATDGWEKFWGGYEDALAQGQTALGSIHHGDLLTSSGEWIGVDGTPMALAGKNGKTIATLAAGYIKGFKAPTPEISRAATKWEQDYTKYLAEGNWAELAKLRGSITDTLEGYMAGADASTRPDVFDGKVRKLTPDQMMNFYTMRQGTYDRYKYWLDNERWNDIDAFKQQTESGMFSQDVVMRFLNAMSGGQSLLAQFGTPNWVNSIQYNAQQGGFYGQQIVDPNTGETKFVSGLTAASMYVQQFENLQNQLAELSKKYPQIQSMVPNILQPFQDIYQTAQDQLLNPSNYNITAPQVALRGALTLEIGKAGTRYYLDANVDFGAGASIQYGNGQGGFMGIKSFNNLLLGGGNGSGGAGYFPLIQQPKPVGVGVLLPQYQQTTGYNSSSYESDYKIKTSQQPQPVLYTFNFENGVSIGNMNGQITPDNIEGLQAAISDGFKQTLVDIVDTQYGSNA